MQYPIGMGIHANRVYKTKMCAECGVTFEGRNSRKVVFCSVECSFRYHLPLKPSHNGCIVWSGKIACAYGYGVIGFRGAEIRAHRYAWERVHGKIPERMVIRHKCDNPPCVNIDHLEIGTQTDNTLDTLKRGRVRRGEAHGNAKLKEVDVAEMKRRVRGGETPAAIARSLGLKTEAVARIIRGERWRHVN